MVWFWDTFLKLKKDDSIYGDRVILELLDGWRIRLEMDNCPDPETCDCPELHKNKYDGYLARDLSLEEVTMLRDACDQLIIKYHEYKKGKSK